MKRIYHNYQKWEDHKNGLYDCIDPNERHSIQESYNLLTDLKKFYSQSVKMISKWKYATEHNLTNLEINRKAWIGQAVCCYNHGAKSYSTIIAWNMLTLSEQERANNIAKEIIELFELKQSKSICLKLDLE